MRTAVVYSGGLDSTTLLYHLRDEGHEISALTINYGQRHCRELASAEKICRLTDIPHATIELPSLAQVFGSNSLSDSAQDVPEGTYTPESMQQTTVPNRNMILLSIALGWAISNNHQAVAFGAHSGEYTPYPDCRSEFADAMNQVAGICDWNSLQVLAPFVSWNKADIVRRGVELNVPFELTWTCYLGEEKHCGRCGTCLDRREAFRKSDIPDPTAYE